MRQKLIKQSSLDVGERTYVIRYYRRRTVNGSSRYSAELEFDQDDRIILDADSIDGLETILARLVHASIYSRMLVGTGRAA